MKKIFILGQEGTGWSIDKDRFYTIKAIKSLGKYEITNNIFKADVVYAIWWNQLLNWKFKIFNKVLKKKIIATITNDLSHQENSIKNLIPIVDIFVYANSKQKNKLLELGVSNSSIYFNPFYVDEDIFKSISISKKDICDKFDINYEKIKNKKLIGSFQRDSLGVDLLKPKWQKDPDMLISILNKLDKDLFILLLAGPRRHYIVSECIKYGIEYIFIGNESYIKDNKDDIKVNSIGIEDMPYLYNLIDLYIVSSKSEGGPKAIPESVLCNTPILSTDVGFAKDLLDDENLYKDSEEAVLKINNLSVNSQVSKYYSFSLFKKRIEKILKGLD
jgi:glycosyltransferase involved in cell wall biosynthesis